MKKSSMPFPPKKKGKKKKQGTRGQIVCVWCNRITQVNPGYSFSPDPRVADEEWSQTVEEMGEFYCSRPNCKAHRS